jgi:DNA-binding response OmpR family regulator
MSKHILLVDDDALLRHSLGFHFEQAGYHASLASSAEEALQCAIQDPPDLAVLDIGLPGMDGLNALRIFKEQLHVPVIFLTARRQKLDEVLGLDLGADDYVTKPFDPDVLLSHVKAVLRRTASHPEAQPEAPEPAPLMVGDLSFDPASKTASLDGQPLDLSRREFDLLFVLAQNAGRVVAVDDLLEQVWGAASAVERHVIYVHLRWVREKIEADPDHPRRILTARGVGYKLVPQEAARC